jgi:hypothetical protein
MDFLTGHAWMTRGESNRNLQLPDLVTLKLDNETLDGFDDTSPCFAFVAVLRQGKLNQFGKIEYAGMMRHKSVDHCAVNSLAFWLYFLYHNQKINLHDKTLWYNIYIQPGRTKLGNVCPKTQNAKYERLFDDCGIKSTKLSHSVRAGGLNMAESAEVSEGDLRRGGRWGRDKMEGSYLHQLPRPVLRALSGWDKSGIVF